VSGGIVLAVELAALALLLARLNARDRRRDRAVATVLEACPPSLRSAIAVRARAGLLSRRVVIVLDSEAGDHDAVWAAVRRLADGLPPGVSLAVDGRGDPAPPVAISVGCAASGSR
jgi:hypothetical protein